MMRFFKMHGLGNDFVMVDGTETPALSAAEVAALCDRRRGIGADGVIIASPIDGGRVRMEYWNADGSPAEMCGNGLRCTAWFGHRRGWTDGDVFTVETERGPLEARILGDHLVRVEVGPVDAEGSAVVDGVEIALANVGNPHAVVAVDDVESAPVRTVGPRLETDAAFAEGTNVEFMAVTEGAIDLRVWERGVGETLACGSGAAAAAAVAIRAGKAASPVAVRLPGGELLVEIIDGVAFLTGPIAEVYEGTWR